MEPQTVDLAGRVALITGASSGLGRATALALGRSKARVVVNHTERSRDSGLAVVAEIEASGGEAIAIAADVSIEADVDRLFAQAGEHFGTVDMVVANAGLERPAAFEAMTLADWRTVIDVNLTGAFLTARAAVRTFLRPRSESRPPGPIGNLVFVSSVHETIPWSGQANYAASKGGIAMLMRSLAQELAPRGVRVNAVAPGAIKTAINQHVWSSQEARDALLTLIPYGRLGMPEDVANAILWLLSDASDYVNGTSLVVDGGMLLYPCFRGNG
ncbi:MAG: glucose 1-dehydrogenase [Hyphomicrobiaceae bacterium]|nr:glucose 1-dehydrogenase [Hyphomicrobiaceae bacterium]